MDSPRPPIILPPQHTSFIGRDTEIAEIHSLLADPACRLLTLAGLGGVGKTRLAIEAARGLQPSFADGLCFVLLQPLQSPDQIIQTILNSLNLTDVETPQSDLLAYLGDKHLLLVLDNYEHVLDGAPLLADILNAAPDVKLLITSRQSLRLQEEWLREVHGLTYPEGSQTLATENFSAVQLFIERARRLRGDVDFTVQVEHIVRICQLVEGMPLALELAAGWVKTLSCAAIVREIEHNLDILASNTRNSPDRHRSMRAVFDQSWRLLGDDERQVMSGFAVFRGGCTHEAAARVAGATLSLLAGLVEKSLLRHDPATGRYDIHELLRQYTAEILDQTPEIRESVLDRHCDYYTGFLHQLKSTIHLMNQSEVVRDIDNLRVAWKRAVQQQNPTALLRAAPSLHWLYHFQSWHDEGATMFYLAEEAVREMPMTDDGRFLLGMIQLLRGFYQPGQPTRMKFPPVDIEAALALWDGLEERPEMGLPLTRAMLGLLNRVCEPGQAIAVARRGLDFSRRHGDLSGVAISLSSLACVYCEALGKFADARQLLEEALAIDRQIGFDLNARWVEGILGNLTRLQGRYREAKTHFEASVAHHYAGNITKNLDYAISNLGNIALELHEDAAAARHFEESVSLASALHNHMQHAQSRAGLGLVAVFQNDSTAAAAYFEDSSVYFRTVNIHASSHNERPGLLALMLGHYEFALAHYEATIAHYRDAGYRVPLMCAHSRAGHALIGLADETAAKPYLFDALREAADMGALQVLLEALLGIAQLSVVPRPLAVELLTLIAHHEASNRYSRTRAKHLLAGLEASLVQTEFAEAAARGQALNLEAAAALVEPFAIAQPGMNQPLIDPLSQRELEVLALIAAGLTNQEIADQLYIGISTVKKHVNRIYSKLDVTHRAQAVAAARTMKILL